MWLRRFATSLPFFYVSWVCVPTASAQYKENPLNNSHRYFCGFGVNSMDGAAHCAEFIFSRKGEGPLIESRLGFSREWSGLPSDTCTTTNNWQLEPGLFLGDGWRFRKVALTGSLGINLSYRRYCRIEAYEELMRSVLLPALGVRMTCAIDLAPLWALQFNVIGNLGFRNAYGGATLGVSYFIKD